MAWRLLSAIMLLVMGGIHLYLVFYGVGGLLGALFVLNAVGALVLAIAVIVLRGRLLSLATVLSLLFMVGTLLALVLALTVGLFGIHEVLSFRLVSQDHLGTCTTTSIRNADTGSLLLVDPAVLAGGRTQMDRLPTKMTKTDGGHHAFQVSVIIPRRCGLCRHECWPYSNGVSNEQPNTNPSSRSPEDELGAPKPMPSPDQVGH